MSNSKIILVSLLFCLCSGGIASAKMQTTYSVNSSTMKKVADWADKDTVMFVSLDDVVMMPKSEMFSYNSNPYLGFIRNMVSLGSRMPRYNKIVSQWYAQRQVKLVEEGWEGFIKSMQAKGVTVYGISYMPIHLTNIEPKIHKDVQELGVLFTNKINGKEEMQIEKHENWHSSFYKGIIFLGPFGPSHTLMEFIKVTNISPKKMLFISNSKPDLKRMDKSLRVFDMEFYNVEYRGVRETGEKPDEKTVKLQQKHLINQGIWLEDEQAAAMLKSLDQGNADK